MSDDSLTQRTAAGSIVKRVPYSRFSEVRRHAPNTDEPDRSWTDEDHRPSSHRENPEVDPWKLPTPHFADENVRETSVGTVHSGAIGVQDELPFLFPGDSTPSQCTPATLGRPDPEAAVETENPSGDFLKEEGADSEDDDDHEGEPTSRLGEELEFESDFDDVTVTGFDPGLAAETANPVDDFFEHEDAKYDDGHYLEVEAASQSGEEFEYELEFADVDLPDFDPGLHLPPSSPFGDDNTLRHAIKKAAAAVRVLAMHSNCDPEAALNYMTDFFLQFQHHATYRAIERLVWEGLDVETLQVMIELREVWQDRAAWSEPLRSTERSGTRYQTSLPWKFAYEICRSRWQYPPDQMIDDDWFSEWRLQTGTDHPTPPHFTTYVLAKVENRRCFVSPSDFLDEERPAWESAANPLRNRRFLDD